MVKNTPAAPTAGPAPSTEGQYQADLEARSLTLRLTAHNWAALTAFCEAWRISPEALLAAAPPSLAWAIADDNGRPLAAVASVASTGDSEEWSQLRGILS